MIYVMNMQKNKSMGEIMFQINNSHEFKKFQLNEKLIKWLFRGVIYFYIVLNRKLTLKQKL